MNDAGSLNTTGARPPGAGREHGGAGVAGGRYLREQLAHCFDGRAQTVRLCCRSRQQHADTRRTHQKRHARRLPTLTAATDLADLQEKSCRRSPRVPGRDPPGLHGKE
jgi:hypothetical protein